MGFGDREAACIWFAFWFVPASFACGLQKTWARWVASCLMFTWSKRASAIKCFFFTMPWFIIWEALCWEAVLNYFFAGFSDLVYLEKVAINYKSVRSHMRSGPAAPQTDKLPVDNGSWLLLTWAVFGPLLCSVMSNPTSHPVSKTRLFKVCF